MHCNRTLVPTAPCSRSPQSTDWVNIVFSCQLDHFYLYSPHSRGKWTGLRLPLLRETRFTTSKLQLIQLCEPISLLHSSAFYSVTWFLIRFTCHFLPISIHSILSLLLLSRGLKGAKGLWKGVSCWEGAVWPQCVFIQCGCYWSDTQMLWMKGPSCWAGCSSLRSPDHADWFLLDFMPLNNMERKFFGVGKKHYLYIFIYDAI